MGKVIRPQRKGKGSVFTSHTRRRIGAVKMHKLDYAEREGYVKGVVKDLVHEAGRGAPVAKVQFKNAYSFKKDNILMTAPEGMYTGQFVFQGKKGRYYSRYFFLPWLFMCRHYQSFGPYLT